MTIYSIDVLLFLLGTSLLFHVQFELLLLDLHISFSRGRSGGLVSLISGDANRRLVVKCQPETHLFFALRNVNMRPVVNA